MKNADKNDIIYKKKKGMIFLKPNKTDIALLSMLRQKQERLGIRYIKTDSGLYKFFAVVFYIAFTWAVIMCLLSALSNLIQLSVNLSYLENPNGQQAQQIPAIRSNAYSTLLLTAFIIPSVFFISYKKYIPSVCFGVVPSALLIIVCYNSMSQHIDGGTFAPFIFRHLLPLCLIIISIAVCCTIGIRQKVLDKKGTDEISEKIYRRYNLLADNITEEQWQELLAEYPAVNAKKRHRRKEVPSSPDTEKQQTEV